jgi:hypothetical protein
VLYAMRAGAAAFPALGPRFRAYLEPFPQWLQQLDVPPPATLTPAAAGAAGRPLPAAGWSVRQLWATPVATASLLSAGASGLAAVAPCGACTRLRLAARSHTLCLSLPSPCLSVSL